MASWDLGRAIRSWRDRVSPEQAGLPRGRGRRAPGLRREELAGLAGISVDYLTRLEQGRATAPSAQVVEALARSLRLGDTERELLFRLAGLNAPGPGIVPTRIGPSVQRLLDRFTHTPTAVFDATWTLLTANTPYNALLGDTTRWAGWERNAVWRHVHGLETRARMSAAERALLAEQLLGDLRAAAVRYPDDPRLTDLVQALLAASPRCAELWRSGGPDDERPPARHKVIDHPQVGPIELDCDTLIVAGDDLRIMIYTAEPGSEDAGRLDLAVTLGTQEFSRP
ncbi:MAG TPA: helix-turn-helix transcriptional regulator [Microlunatus sp.]|nr:helix-turn-helix transcriptional regulator [Microlunatus sp.]